MSDEAVGLPAVASPESPADVLDFVADYSIHAVETGLDAEEVVEALENVANEVHDRKVNSRDVPGPSVASPDSPPHCRSDHSDGPVGGHVDEAVLEALAHRGREYVLWELDAAGAMGTVGFRDVEPNIDASTFEDSIDAYTEKLDLWFETLDDEARENEVEHAEREYGALADAVMEFFDATE